jgi:cysteine desulfurase
MADYYASGHANPSSPHQAGREARRVLEAARHGIARLLGANVTGPDADRLIFTSGGTEANNLALRGMAAKGLGRVVISAIEHPSLVGAAAFLAKQGYDIQQLGVSPDGVVQPGHLSKLLRKRTRVVSVMLGNNETGVLQPVGELAAHCHELGIAMHTDAVQVVGKLPVNFRSLGVSAMSISAHKFHGPSGIGALLVRSGTQLEPILFGGFHEWGLRPGSPSVALAVGMHRALELWYADCQTRQERMSALRDRLEELLRAGDPELVVNGGNALRLPHTSSVSFPGLDRQALLMALDLAGVACSTGSACSSGSSEPSPVLLAMGCPRTVINGALRLSIGATTTDEDVERAADCIVRVAKDLRAKKRRLFQATISREKLAESL